MRKKKECKTWSTSFMFLKALRNSSFNVKLLFSMSLRKLRRLRMLLSVTNVDKVFNESNSSLSFSILLSNILFNFLVIGLFVCCICCWLKSAGTDCCLESEIELLDLVNEPSIDSFSSFVIFSKIKKNFLLNFDCKYFSLNIYYAPICSLLMSLAYVWNKNDMYTSNYLKYAPT